MKKSNECKVQNEMRMHASFRKSSFSFFIRISSLFGFFALHTMGLIKSTNVPTSASPFSMADVEKAAKGMLLRARQQADQLLAAAQVEGEKLKAEAKVQGMAEGMREGHCPRAGAGRKAGEQQALNEHKTQLQQAVAALNQAATTLNTSRGDLESAALQEVVKLAIAIARRVTKRQGLIEPQVFTTNLEEAMKLVVQQAGLRIVIHPSQRKTLDAALPKLGLKWPSLKHVEVVEDAEIAPGGCRIVTCQGQINADLDVQLDRVVADLLPRTGGGVSMSILDAQLEAVDTSMPFGVHGQVTAVTGMTIEAIDLTLPLGSLCRIHSFGAKTCMAEVIGFRDDRTLLMPLTNPSGVARGDVLESISAAPRIWCSEQLLGRVLNGFGQPIDGKGCAAAQ